MHKCAPLAPWAVPPYYCHGSLDHAGEMPDHVGTPKDTRLTIDVVKPLRTLDLPYDFYTSE
jgi:hypothetical protein